jgi:hypothetical protein
MGVSPPPPPDQPPSDQPPAGWSDRYAPPPPTGDIVAYLQANSGRYTKEALDQRLLAAGHPPEAVAAAWSVVNAADESAGLRDRRQQTAGIIALAYVLVWLLVVVLVIAPTDTGPYAPTLLLGGLLAFFLFLPGILAVAIALRSGWLRRATVGRVVAFSLVPMLILFTIAGLCVSSVSPSF